MTPWLSAIFLAAVAITVDLWRLHPALAFIFDVALAAGVWLRWFGSDEDES